MKEIVSNNAISATIALSFSQSFDRDQQIFFNRSHFYALLQYFLSFRIVIKASNQESRLNGENKQIFQ